jgi:hypothetical protein
MKTVLSRDGDPNGLMVNKDFITIFERVQPRKEVKCYAIVG